MPEWTTLKRMIWLLLLRGASAVIRTVTGTAPLVLENAIAAAIKSLKQYGKCTQPSGVWNTAITQYGLCEQNGTPTPDAPVDIMCNNGAIKYGWYDIITTSSLSGYGTYVSPSSIAGNRAYKWFKDLPNGAYQFSVDGDYELIVQWRDPADPSNIVPSAYENLSGWMTSGEVVLDKEGGGYGIAVRRTSGTSSITPSNFDGVLHVAERGLYVVGTPEVLTVSADGAETQTVSDVPMLLSVGDYADEAEIISGIKTGKVRAYAIDGTENWTMSSSVSGVFLLYPADMKPCNPPQIGLSTHFRGTSASTASMPDLSIKNTYGSGGVAVLCVRYNAKTSVADFKADAAAAFASGNPWIVLYPLATEQTEQTTAHPQLVNAKYNTASVTAEVSDIQVTFTTGEQTAPAPYSPLPIVCNNGELKWNGTAVVADGTPEVLTVSATGAETQTVTDIPTLLSVRDYEDEGEIIGGAVTHKVGIKVLDGTESGWALSDSGSTHRFRGIKPSDCHTPASRAPLMSSHFFYVGTGQTQGGAFIGASSYWYFIPTDQTIDTVEKWTAWVAAQYAAGTPVIVLYPLATETTEQGTPHSLHTTEGDNVVDVVSNVDPVELEIEYSASV